MAAGGGGALDLGGPGLRRRKRMPKVGVLRNVDFSGAKLMGCVSWIENPEMINAKGRNR